MDPDWVSRHALSVLENTWWGGEAVASYLIMAGWVASLGGRPHFDYNTIWFDPFPVDFSQPSPFRYRTSDPWVQKFTRLYETMADVAGKDDFLVGAPAILPANDLLSMHLGTQNFLMALMDHPAWMRQAIEDGARDIVLARKGLRDLIKDRHDFWYGNGGWMPFWAPQPYIGTQSDVSCMLSTDHYEQFVVPELDVYGAVGAVWYHLDGGDARQHLPRLLSLPYLRVVQYTPTPTEPPNGAAHLAMYRQIQKAGRIVHIQVGKDQVEPLCRGLDPRFLMMDVSGCVTPDEGRELLAAARRWTAA